MRRGKDVDDRPDQAYRCGESSNSGSVGAVDDAGMRRPVTIGGHSEVCLGMTIGKNCTIGMGSVVTRNIPVKFLAEGNLRKVIRKLETKE